MTEPIVLSRSRLETFLICRRQFQLRYLLRLPWPLEPVPEQDEAAMEDGKQFHQLLERYFLGLPVEPVSGDKDVQHWWYYFRQNGPAVPDGRFLPEHTLTIPVGDGLPHLITGRFDLLVIGQRDGEAFAHIFDWKTGKPRPVSDLRDDWQTRLYLAMLTAGGEALVKSDGGLKPEQVAMTYWYTAVPSEPRTIRYNAAWHSQNWANLQAIVAEIDAALVADEWPLAADLTPCRTCAYRVYCGRQEAGQAVAIREEWPELEEDDLLFEPDVP